MDTPIAVVGAGPAGLMLAAELRLGGAQVTVLERRDRPATESRASTLHARTMEILASRGLRELFGELPCEPRGHFGGIPMDLTLPSDFPGQWKVPQTRTEALLADRARSLGAEVRRGWTVRGVTAAGDHVRVTADTARGPRELRAAYVVACDGQDSTVRTLLGADFPGRPARREMLRADVGGIDVPNRRFERRERGMVVAARNPAGVTRVMVHEFGRPVRAGREPDFGDVVDAWKRVTGEDLSGGDPLWVNAFDDTDRQLARYRHGRVLFAGDAAHVQMPIGGQALNLGLQDAVNLGWKLAAVAGGRVPADLLDTYHDERHAAGRQVLANIRAQAELLLGTAAVEPVRAVVAALLAAEPNRVRLAGVVSGLGLRYPAGPDDHPAVGTRLPGVDLHDGRGLLVAAPSTARDAIAAGWRGRVRTASGPVPATGTTAALIRPDGHLAWAGTDPTAARPALTRWFGPIDRREKELS
ncbi:FAD-dependent oxidoreductase [Paractinoplanes rishiriensis]|uniref:Oxygenase n=1 Tax=Paractinoplanes rishiriensis TaxID=1050105 RepID=A0A919JTM8_9ACTN|nr:FAD-dependent oxidoreductase [Actinoplanes rishiriensis]GIE92973.1 putative oxygenase [Actinoplanes rishiriensis]